MLNGCSDGCYYEFVFDGVDMLYGVLIVCVKFDGVKLFVLMGEVIYVGKLFDEVVDVWVCVLGLLEVFVVEVDVSGMKLNGCVYVEVVLFGMVLFMFVLFVFDYVNL